MDRSFNAFRPLWAAMLAIGLFISSGVYPVAAQNTDELEVSQPSVQSSSSTVGAETSVGPPPLPATPEHATPPPLPTFYIAEGGQPVGPLNMGELQQKVAAGTLTSSTLGGNSPQACQQYQMGAARVFQTFQQFQGMRAPIHPNPSFGQLSHEQRMRLQRRAFSAHNQQWHDRQIREMNRNQRFLDNLLK